MEPVENPSIEWYMGVSRERGATPRCPFASVDRCPRYYESLSLLGSAGSTKIPTNEDNRLKARWEKSDLWPKTGETSASIMGNGDRHTIFSNFCPEVSYDRFGFFASSLVDYADDIDRDFACRHLERIGEQAKSWKWKWQHLQPRHFTECPLYSPLVHAAPQQEPVAAEILTLKPGIWGMSVDIKTLGRRLVNWIKR
jgi:hypothetical protein